MQIQVDTSAGAKGEAVPSSLHLDGRNIDISDVVEQWLVSDDRYFEVKDASGNIYVLRSDPSHATWELLMFLSKRGADMPNIAARRVGSRSHHFVNGKI